MPIFSDSQMNRYMRHLILTQVGFKGQQKISAAKILCVGAGGLGSPALLYLAAAGVGTIGIVDGDVVDESNLQRQIVHFTADIGRPKVISAKEKINQVNPDVSVLEHHNFLDASNALTIINKYDFIIDGCDNFNTKFLINDACVMLGKAFSHAGILRFEGQAMTVIPKKSRCYRCLFREPPPTGSVPSCADAGVLGVVAGTLGTIQATEALKFILGKGDLLTDRLLIYDAWSMRFREIKGKRDPACAICGDQPTILELKSDPRENCEL